MPGIWHKTEIAFRVASVFGLVIQVTLTYTTKQRSPCSKQKEIAKIYEIRTVFETQYNVLVTVLTRTTHCHPYLHFWIKTRSCGFTFITLWVVTENSWFTILKRASADYLLSVSMISLISRNLNDNTVELGSNFNSLVLLNEVET